MAASDFAALFSSVGISFWTQRSFREPLLFSAASCLAGGTAPGRVHLGERACTHHGSRLLGQNGLWILWEARL